MKIMKYKMKFPELVSPLQNELFINLFSVWVRVSLELAIWIRLQSHGTRRLILSSFSISELSQSGWTSRNPRSKDWKLLFTNSSFEICVVGLMLLRLLLWRCSKILSVIVTSSLALMLRASVITAVTWLFVNINFLTIILKTFSPSSFIVLSEISRFFLSSIQTWNCF